MHNYALEVAELLWDEGDERFRVGDLVALVEQDAVGARNRKRSPDGMSWSKHAIVVHDAARVLRPGGLALLFDRCHCGCADVVSTLFLIPQVRSPEILRLEAHCHLPRTPEALPKTPVPKTSRCKKEF